MEEGSLRCDANVSVNLEGQGLGTKVEVKNLNSFKFVKQRRDLRDRQADGDPRERGGSVTSETRLWNENRDVTESMRTKESSSDYRYFPEPDLPPFAPGRGVPSLGGGLPRRASRARAGSASSTASASARTRRRSSARRRQTADWFEQAVALGADPQSAALWMASDVKKHLNRTGRSLAESPLSPRALRRASRAAGRPSASTAGSPRRCSRPCSRRTRIPLAIISEKGWEQITDPAVLRTHIARVTGAHARDSRRDPGRRPQADGVPRRRDHEGDLRAGRTPPWCRPS